MELKFPAVGTPEYTWLEYEIEKKSGSYPGSEGSFCRTYMETLEDILTDYTGRYHMNSVTTVKGVLNLEMEALDILTGHERGKKGPQYDHMKEHCKRINLQYAECREKINSAMVEFLFKNDGVIDRWPFAENAIGIVSENKDNAKLDKLKFPFAYFGDEYKPAGYEVYREKEFPVYNHNFYRIYEPEELAKAREYAKQKHEQYFSNKAKTGFKGDMKRFAAIQPAIFAVLFLAFNLLCYFKDIIPVAQVKEWAEQFSAIPSILLFIPKVILYVFAYVSKILRLNDILFWIATLGISLCGIILGVKKVTSPKLARVSKSTLKRMWEENTDALEKKWAIEKKIKDVSSCWNNTYCNYLRDKYRKNH